jgi:NADH-quinone oxidoreductase subunit E
MASDASDLFAAGPIDPSSVRRFEHGSRVPGWDIPADPAKDPAAIPDPAQTPVPDALRTAIEAEMAKYPDRRSASIPALFHVQNLYGWCTPEGVEQAAAVMRLTPGYLVSVASFYDMLNLEPVGRNRVYVCTNISCSLLGADPLLAALQDEAAEDPDIFVRGFECLGACDIAPMASVNGQFVGPIALDEVPTLIQQVQEGVTPLPDKQLARRRSVDPEANDPEPEPSEP